MTKIPRCGGVIKQKESKNWFHRLANGKIDSDDKASGQERLSLSELPINVLGEIAEKLNLKSLLNVRKVSRMFRNVVDMQKSPYKEIVIRTEIDMILIRFDETWVRYSKMNNGCLMEYGRFDEGEETKRKIFNDNYLEIALNDLKIALKNPKYQLEHLGLSFGLRGIIETDQVRKFIESSETPIQVKSLQINYEGNREISSILQYFKSGLLEDISFGWTREIDMCQLIKMDHWKMAKTISYDARIPVDIEDVLHFNRFECAVESFSAEDVIFLRDVLSLSPNFEYCELRPIKSRWNIAEIGKALGAAVINNKILYNHPIPRTNEFLEFKICIYGLDIEKRKM